MRYDTNYLSRTQVREFMIEFNKQIGKDTETNMPIQQTFIISCYGLTHDEVEKCKAIENGIAG